VCFAKKGKALSGELAGELGLTYSNASKVIKSVENKGLIQRELGKEDKRNMYFSLSKKGEEVLKEIKCSKMELPNITLN
jgi:Transcriptional regulators